MRRRYIKKGSNKNILLPFLFLVVILGIFIFYEFNYSEENIFYKILGINQNKESELEPYYEEKYINFNEESIVIKVNDDKKLDIDTNCNISLSSSDNDIITIDKDVISAKKEGNAVVSAKCNDLSESINVNVISNDIKINSIKSSISNKSIEVGKSININQYIIIEPSDATNKELKYTTSNSDIVSVDNNGKIIGKKEGNARITIISVDGNYNTYIDVNVYKKEIKPSKITIKGSPSIKVNQSEKLVASITPSNINSKVLWKNSNNDIANIDSNGNIKCIKAGNTTITASIDNISTTHDIKCINTITPSKNNITTYSSMYSTSGMPAATISFTTTDNINNITISSSNSNIATGEIIKGNDNAGSIKINVKKEYGNSIITLKTSDGITTDINVTNNVYKVKALLASTTRMGACVSYPYGNKYEVYLNNQLINNWDNIIIGNNTYTKDNYTGSNIITSWQGQSVYVTINGNKYSAIFTKEGGCN